MDSAHYDNINCLKPTTASPPGRMNRSDTYDPDSNVTRSQMALFLTRAASVAGIDLGDAMDMGFTDLDTIGADRVQAINVLAAKKIMPGRTATTFDPLALVTRVDMAQHLFTLLDLALDSIHIDTLPTSLDGDGTGIEVNVTDGNGMRPDDHFGDVRRTLPVHLADMINAIYELGVTNGTNSQVGDNGTFDPLGNVTRAQMASFIMRALGHTNLRPEGLTAQQTSNQTQISVRDKDFKPVPDRRVELISSNYPEDAFDRNGRCITDRNFVTGSFTVNSAELNTSGYDTCSIDIGDEPTDAAGNVTFEVGSASGARFSVMCTTPADSIFRFTGEPGAPATVWAWQGDTGDTVSSSTELVEPVAGNATNPGRATQATVSGGSDNVVKMGQTLTYEIQLRNSRGQPVGPTPGVNHDYRVTIVKTAEAAADDDTYTVETLRRTTVHSPDGSGLITIPITNPDPTPYHPTDANNADVQVSVTVVAVTGNTLPLVDRTEGTTSTDRTQANQSGTAVVRVDPPDEKFSDNSSVANSMSAASTPWRLRSGVASRNRNSISVEVFDQYGAPFGGNGNMVAPSDSTNPRDFPDGSAVALPARGRSTITYTHTGDAALSQTITVALQGSDGAAVNDLDGSPISESVRVHWAAGPSGTTPAASAEARAVLVGDPRMNFIVITDANSLPAALSYGPDDTFFIEGVEVTLAQFEEVLGSHGARNSDPISDLGNLTWARFDLTRPRDGATLELTGLGCRPSAATR